MRGAICGEGGHVFFFPFRNYLFCSGLIRNKFQAAMHLAFYSKYQGFLKIDKCSLP